MRAPTRQRLRISRRRNRHDLRDQSIVRLDLDQPEVGIEPALLRQACVQKGLVLALQYLSETALLRPGFIIGRLGGWSQQAKSTVPRPHQNEDRAGFLGAAAANCGKATGIEDPANER